MMNLQTIDFIRLLPQFMNDDTANKGLAAGINALVPELSKSVGLLSAWDRLNEIPESDLDGLAWELNVAWYDKTAPIATKRSLIRNSVAVHRTLGTKWAVESVVLSYFGDGYIEEWFEYDGEPGHFRVYSSNPSLNAERLNEFIALLNKVKRASSVLDGVFINLSGQSILYAGTALHEISKEQYAIGAAALN